MKLYAKKNLLKRGKTLILETRHWDEKRRITISLRKKEFEADYRYFPEQDLTPIEIDDEFIDKIKSKLPEMPSERAHRLRREYNLSEFDSDNLVLDKDIANFYEDGVNSDPSFGPNEYKQFCNWLMNNISGWLNEHNITIKNTRLQPKQVVDLVNYVKEGKITTKIAKSLMGDLMEGDSVSKILEKKGKARISDRVFIEKLSREAIDENPKIVEDCVNNAKAIEALIGRVMKKTRGQADPWITREVLINLLRKMDIID